MDFDNYNFHPSILAGARTLGYSKPTPLQAQAIPAILEGRDVIGLAKSGTRTTEAFALPVLQNLQSGPRGYIRALVLSPTREQALQTCEVFIRLGSRTDLRSVAVYSGVGEMHQKKQLHRGTEIVVACPDQLIKFLWRGILSLTDLEILVIDEADSVLDMGYLTDINNIIACTPDERQTLLFSATASEKVQHLARKILHEPVAVESDGQTTVNTTSRKPQDLKTKLLLEILKKDETDSVMVFTADKKSAELMAHQIIKAGYQVTLLQGNLVQKQRQAAPANSSDDSLKILVATDIAARGIDVSRISRIIKSNTPENTNANTQSVNLTGRAEKKDGTFVTSADAGKIRALEKLLDSPIKPMTH